ncbi:MAG: OmpA family protein [Endomicrobium sp.]|nr:OmpA family protein [Endomicrobium sp.]
MFETNKADLKAEGEKEIESLTELLGSKYKYKRIVVEGHTGSTGTNEVNEKLSLMRAEVVYNEFLRQRRKILKKEDILCPVYC